MQAITTVKVIAYTKSGDEIIGKHWANSGLVLLNKDFIVSIETVTDIDEEGMPIYLSEYKTSLGDAYLVKRTQK